jgi:hypothetical protein
MATSTLNVLISVFGSLIIALIVFVAGLVNAWLKRINTNIEAFKVSIAENRVKTESVATVFEERHETHEKWIGKIETDVKQVQKDVLILQSRPIK